ncbi:MAG: hypothetical protein PCFJNLEI_02611 [Verrucomicrobiae bacterium]|nr:hypothetical protein [Verrucomicrobiae bacterium]
MSVTRLPYRGVNRQLWRFCQFCLCLLGGLLPAVVAQEFNPNILRVQSFPLNPYVAVLDGQWEGIRVASDGSCYFGSSTHDNRQGAAFFRYEPTTRTLTLLAPDLSTICGEDPSILPPQGKLHSDITEHNGWLYFGMHLGNYWDEAYTAFTGGHMLGYEMATGQWRDFGVIRSNHTIYGAVGIDRVRNKAIVYTLRWWGSPVGSYLDSINLTTGARTALAGIPYGGGAFYPFVDQRGDCWISQATDSASLMCVRSATGQVDRWTNVLPESGLGSGRFWEWAEALDGDRCVFKLAGGQYLHTFNAAAAGANPSNAITALQNIGPTGAGHVVGGDRVYYIQRANRQVGWQEYQDFHLLSAALNTNVFPAIIDHGLIADQNGRRVWRSHALAADRQGRLFMVGDWWLLPGEQGSSTGTLRHVDGPGTNYTALVRGQFFALVEMLPLVTNQPPNQTVYVGSNVTFHAGVAGYAPLAFQWRHNGTNIAGATTSALTLSNVQTADAGNYDLVITNVLGATTSAVARLTVTWPDSVGDGIPDVWRAQYFADVDPSGATTNHRSCATCDASHTGQDNRFKYVAGIDPTNTTAVFHQQLASVPGQPDQMQLTFAPRWPDRSYVPEYSLDLVDGGYAPLTNCSTNDNGTWRTITDLSATGSKKFYRLKITYP